MQRIRIEKKRSSRKDRLAAGGGAGAGEALPLDPRDPDIVRAKALQRGKKSAA